MLIFATILVILAEILLLSGVRTSYDGGRGSDTGRWFSIHFGPASGYLREWWVNLNAGPGNAVGPGEWRSGHCGHKGLAHCNSAYCGRAWCNAQSWPIFGWLFLRGHSFRMWCGPTYGRTVRDWRIGASALRRSKKVHPGFLYSLVSFR